MRVEVYPCSRCSVRRLLGALDRPYKVSTPKGSRRAQLSYLQLQTVLTEVEAILNDRPLTSVSTDPHDVGPLCPSTLLIGRRLTALSYPPVDDDQLADPDFLPSDHAQLSSLVECCAFLVQRFSRRWRDEYLTSLCEHHHVNGTFTSFMKEGAVVLVQNDTPRLTWPLAVITRLLPSADGVVRVVEVCLANGNVTTRPISRLYPLEVYAPQPSLQPPSRPSRVDSTVAPTTPSLAPASPLRRPQCVAAANGRAITHCLADSDD